MNDQSSNETTTTNSQAEESLKPPSAGGFLEAQAVAQFQPGELSESREDAEARWNAYATEVAKNHPGWTAKQFEADRVAWHERNGIRRKFAFPWGADVPPVAVDPEPEEDGA
jgi:hypothetical protein